MRCFARCDGRCTAVLGRSIFRIITAWSTFAASAGRCATSQEPRRPATSAGEPATIISPRRERSSRAALTSAASASSETVVAPERSAISQRTPAASAPSMRRASSGVVSASTVPRTSTWCTTSSSRCSRIEMAPGRTMARRDCDVNTRVKGMQATGGASIDGVPHAGRKPTRGIRGRAVQSFAASLREQRAREGLGAHGQLHGGAMGVRVRELAREVAHAVGTGLGRGLQRAQHAERLAVAVDERATRVARDAGGDGVDLVTPAAARLAERDALLRAQLRDAQAQRRVAVGEDLVARGGGVRHPGRAAPERDGGVDLAVVGRVELHEREVVVGARVRVGLAGGLHRASRLLRMAVPLFDTKTPLEPLRAEIDAKIAEVVDRGVFILGPEVAAFESEFAAYLGVRHAAGVANGTDALVLALRALGVGPGDEIVVPSFTFYASAEAIPLTGARPVFCDVDPDTCCVTVETVRTALTPRTKAVIAVHLFGNVAPIAQIEALGVPVVEDSAQAAGAVAADGGRPGALGTIATFSFFPSKNLGAFGDGGAVVPSDDALDERVRMLRFHGSRDKESFELVGYNSRLDE